MFKLSTIVMFLALAGGAPAFAAETATFNDQAEKTAELLDILIKGVDECFNPSHQDANKATKDELISLRARLETYADAFEEGSSAEKQKALSSIARDRAKFDERSPFPASLACSTKRACLEMGFEGMDKYPKCRTVRGNKHGNRQYLAFVALMDEAFPALLKSGRADLESPPKAAEQTAASSNDALPAAPAN